MKERRRKKTDTSMSVFPLATKFYIIVDVGWPDVTVEWLYSLP